MLMSGIGSLQPICVNKITMEGVKTITVSGNTLSRVVSTLALREEHDRHFL